MAAPSSKLDYLKRYMSDVKDPSEKRKKRKKAFNPKANSGIVVVDNEIEVHKLKKSGVIEDDPYHDNGPTVAEIFDESIPRGMQDSRKWKSIVSQNANFSEREGGREGRDYDGPTIVRRESPDSDLSPPRHSQLPSQLPLKRSSGSSRVAQSSRRRAASEDSDLSPDRGPSATATRRRSPSPREAAVLGRRRVSDREQRTSRVSRRSSSGDLSPVRSGNHNSSRTARASSRDSDLSPVRPPTSHPLHPPHPSHLSHPSHPSHPSYGEPSVSHRESSSRPPTSAPPTSALPTKTLSGMSAGLQSAETLRVEANERRRREEETFEKMNFEKSGKNAETIFRDRKTGKKRDMKEEAILEEEKAARKKVHDEKFQKWGKGLVQNAKEEENVLETFREMRKPFSRFVDDEDRDVLLKNVDRDGDPMLQYLKMKKAKQRGEESRPRYKGPPPAPNRFAIYPGYRWDGVDRSNGFEKKRFDRISNRSATSEQAYKWSTEDM